MLLVERPTTTVAADPILLHAFARRGRPLTVGDLLRAMSGTGAHISDVMDGLALALRDGLVTPSRPRRDEHGLLTGPQYYELTPAGWSIVEADRLAV